MRTTTAEHVDVLIVGAGLSGIGAACHLRRDCPDHSFQILEARDDVGGTWDLFRFPGDRSDSDMQTLGYAFAPWKDDEAIADGSSILRYVRQTAADYRIEEQIRFGQRVVSADWDGAESVWTVHVQPADGADTVALSCSFLFLVHRLLPLRRRLHAGAPSGSPARSSTRRAGPRTSITPAVVWS